jgi:hypothetical protein
MTMPLPFVIDNLAHRLVDTLNDLLGQSAGKPLDIATAYFSISGYRIVKDGLHKLGAFRLLLVLFCQMSHGRCILSSIKDKRGLKRAP